MVHLELIIVDLQVDTVALKQAMDDLQKDLMVMVHLLPHIVHLDYFNKIDIKRHKS